MSYRPRARNDEGDDGDEADEGDDDESPFDEEQIESFYRDIYSDLSVDYEERQQIFDFFNDLEPAPSKLIWTRSTAFRVGSEFLSGDHDNNVNLLKSINAIVNALERTCMV